eukprot:TRINITY_DN7529_c0_g1_i1.p1 TRINITY_DN7529_c0_g1~~TRINITY_DN7529_c0_g1_i1.p1  ORF type:complete len:294 (+),score=73.33 TRINITY_DN7529_c0_g1_i1:331-1212(+)
MPIGGERTHGQLDHKEGLYLGPDHDQDHPKVKSPTPLFGRNQLPDEELPGIRSALARYIEEVTELGQVLMELLALSLKLDAQHIRGHFTQDPIALVRLFNYPAREEESNWGIGEHTDYGLWTMLKQFAPGLQIEHPTIPNEWVDVPAIDNAFFCNVGDVLDRMTDGRFKSSKHRARNYRPSSSSSSSTDGNNNNINDKSEEYTSRISIPFFFDPSWEAEMVQLPLSHLPPCKDEVEKQKRWDSTSILKFEGKYCEFLAKKVSKVFPRVLPESVVSTLQSTKQHSTRFAIHDIS